MDVLRTVLRIRDLRLLLGALLISATGSWAYNTVLLAYAFQRTHSPTWVAVAALSRLLPVLLASPYAGVVVDRFERVRVMVTADLTMLVLQGGLVAVAALDAPLQLAIVLSALTGFANTVYEPAVSAITPQLAGESDLAAANTAKNGLDSLVIVLGPATGALLLLAGPAYVVFGLNAATFAVSAAIVSRLRVRSRPVDVTQGGELGPLAQVAVGLRAISATPGVALLVAFCAFDSFYDGIGKVLFVQVSEQRLGTGAGGYGYLLGACGAGGLIAIGFANRLAGSARLTLPVIGGMAVLYLPLAGLTLTHQPGVAVVLQVLSGTGMLLVDVLAITALQRATPPDRLGRVFGVFGAVIVATIALGSVIAPPVLHGLGLTTTLLVFGLTIPVLSLAGYPQLHRLDRAAADRVAQLEPRIAGLEALGIFAATSRPVLERLAAACTEASAEPGEVIVAEGEPADALYVLTAGEVEVRARGEAQRTRKIRMLGPGSYFGEIGLIEGIPRTATVRAAAPARMYRIEGADFLAALNEVAGSPLLFEGARTWLARTHPSYRPRLAVPAAAPPP